jgi:magnesium-transporting ATPase (P-type)
MSYMQAEPRMCYRCDYTTTNEVEQCPQCGQKLRTATTVRRLGWLLFILGLFLTAFMGYITYVVTGIVAHSDEPSATSRFTGGSEMLLFMYGIFGFVILFGVVAMAAGAYQIKTGRRNKKLAYVIIGLGIIFLLIGWVVRGLR